MIRIALSLPVAVALLAAPITASASPTSITALRSAHAVQLQSPQPDAAQETPGSTRVTVEVETTPESPSALAASTAAAEPEPEPRPTPTPVYVPTAADRYAAQAHDDRKSGRSLLAGGLAIAGLSYLFTSLGGALAIDKARKRSDDPLTEEDETRGADRQRAYGRALLIPGVGPILAVHRADRAIRGWAAGVAGLGQAVGVGLTILGVHRLARAKRLQRLSVAAMATGRQANVTVGIRF